LKVLNITEELQGGFLFFTFFSGIIFSEDFSEIYFSEEISSLGLLFSSR